ncbi:bifunctional DNA primase/polymerase [Pedococcus bigeumensis]|uniref:bifunctional DNA primase/polymerase n=1 Tax=Pedococcus bigeumensis TaxID=433644 RepID=UPI002FE9FCE4
MSSANNEIRRRAVAMAREHGWYVFRLQIGHNEAACEWPEGNCKTVRPLDHWREASSNDPDVIARWDWSDANAYGIDCDRSGLVIADQDPGAVWPFNGTRVHSTPRGLHHVYEDVLGLGNAAHVEPWGVDVRGVGVAW